MADLIRIDDEVVTADDFVKLLKLTGRYDGLLEEVLKEKLAVHAAKRSGISNSPEELQARADQLRRVWGLHRAADTNRWLDAKGITLDDLETFIGEMLYYEKILEQIENDEAVEAYFKLNSPQFDSIEVSHIVVESEGVARELYAILEDDPESFPDMAKEHSVADTGADGGYVGKVMRGSLPREIEAMVFNAAEGDLLGPFPSADENHFEIFFINAKVSATLDEDTSKEVRRIVRDEWLAARAKEHRIELG